MREMLRRRWQGSFGIRSKRQLLVKVTTDESSIDLTESRPELLNGVGLSFSPFLNGRLQLLNYTCRKYCQWMITDLNLDDRTN